MYNVWYGTKGNTKIMNLYTLKLLSLAFFIGIIISLIKNDYKKRNCKHELKTRGFMPLHGDDSGMRDWCDKCKKWIGRN